MKKAALILGVLFGVLFNQEVEAQEFFVVNAGQVNYLSGGEAKEVLLTLNAQNSSLHFKKDGWEIYRYIPLDSSTTIATKASCRFQNTLATAVLELGESQTYTEHYYLSAKSFDGIHCKTVKEFWIRNMYPGIDYHVSIESGKVKYEFEVKAGANVAQIEWTYLGVNQERVSEKGEIELETNAGIIREETPFIYHKDLKKEIAGEYHRNMDGRWQYLLEDGFITEYDRVIDPVLAWTTFYGGSGSERQFSVKESADQSIFISGNTESPQNIAFHGFQDTIRGNSDFYVARFSPNGQRIWGSYYGGSLNETEGRILMYGSQHMYLYGATYSSDFATKSGHTLFDSRDRDIGIIRLDTSGKPLWSKVFGGDSVELINSAGFSSDSGFIYIHGLTRSAFGEINTRNITRQFSASDEGFLMKIDTGANLQWSQILGGDKRLANDVTEIRVAENGDVYAIYCGYNTNKGTSNSFQQSPTNSGSSPNHLLVRYDSSGSVKWAGYLGGNSRVYKGSLDLDNLGNIYLCGGTTSNTGHIYNPGPRGSSFGGVNEIYVAKLDTSGKLIWSEYMGTSSNEIGYVIRVKNDTTLFLTGTAGTVSFFSGGFQDTANSSGDGFLVRMDSAGLIQWGTYFGGDALEYPYDLSIGKNHILVSGYTYSTDYFGSYGSHQTTMGGGFTDGFLFRAVERNVFSEFIPNKSYCAGDTLTIPYLIEDSVSIINRVRVQLSDNSGSFSNPNTIHDQSRNSSGVDTLFVPIPLNTQASSLYKIRVLITSPKDTIGIETSFEIKSAPNRSYSGTNKLALCMGDSVQLISNNPAGFHFEWTKDGISTGDTGKSILVSSPGKYAVRLEGSNGCKSESSPLTFYQGVYPIPQMDLNDSQFCANKVNLVMTDSSAQSNGIREWKLDGVPFDSSQQTNLFQLLAGTYQLMIKVQSQDLCWDSTTKSIEVIPAPKAILVMNDSQSCANTQQFLFSLPLGNNYSSHVFDFGDSTSFTGDSATHQYSKAGKFTLTLSVSNQYGCVDTIKKQIDVFQAPKADFRFLDTLFCTNLPATRFGNLSKDYTASQWAFGDGDSSVLTHPSHAFDVGNYSVSLIAKSKDDCGDTLIRSFQMHLPPNASISMSDTLVCFGDSVLFESSCDTGLSYSWTGYGAICNLWVADSLERELVVQNNAGCMDTSIAQLAIHPPVAIPSIAQNWDTLSSVNAYSSYQWYYAGTAVSGGNTKNIIATQNGIYRLEVTDANGCAAVSKAFELKNVGFENRSQVDFFSLYPNPNKGQFTLEFREKVGQGEVAFTVLNALGQEMQINIMQTATSSFQIQLLNAAPGFYLLKVIRDAEVHWIKVEVQR